MKATGIVRRIDDLGRIVIPKEIRRTLHIRQTDPLEIFTAQNGEIILKKYSPIGELGDMARQVTDALAQTSGLTACVCDRDRIIAASGKYKKDLLGQEITVELRQLISNRTGVTAQNTDKNFVIPVSTLSAKHFVGEVIFPILAEGDTAGAVLLLSPESIIYTDGDVKLTSAAALILGRQLES